jgi:hypothetical protein
MNLIMSEVEESIMIVEVAPSGPAEHGTVTVCAVVACGCFELCPLTRSR